MPLIKAAIDPITRIEGHLGVEIEVDTVDGVQQIVEARAIGTLFRGFELILQGRDPRDAPIITSRICGVCPTAHGKVASLTLDNAFGITPPSSARILRNLVEGACMLESDILHFYLLSLPDYFQGPGKGPWMPGWDTGRRFDTATLNHFTAHYLQAIEKRRKVHEMAAIFGGKLPHTPAYIAGGFTAVPTTDNINAFRTVLDEIIAFIEGVYLPDVELLASLFDEYLTLGRGPGNLLSYGVFELNGTGTNKLFDAGRIQDGGDTVLPVDIGAITEHVTHSWYDDSTDGLHPAQGETIPQHPKENAYSWLKAPRYQTAPYECGPLSRMWVAGEYRNGISVMDRHRARVREALIIAAAMRDWLDELNVGSSVYTTHAVPQNASGVGLTEAPRGALAHWIQIVDGKIARYQVLTPTCWNVSPKDGAGVHGPLEEALIGLPVNNIDEPIEALRVIHSFDPCLDCATHVMRPGEQARLVAIGGSPIS
jgi:hydrogenase large subunit